MKDVVEKVRRLESVEFWIEGDIFKKFGAYVEKYERARQEVLSPGEEVGSRKQSIHIYQEKVELAD